MHLTNDFVALYSPVLHLFQRVHESKTSRQAVLLFLQCGGKGLGMSEISEAVSEAGLVTVLEGPLFMAGQRCSLHIAGQPDCSRFWSVLLSQKEKSTGRGMVFSYDFIEKC